ncbi:MAG: hypothetical protein JSU05_09630, partial [Bacteroidetes bacterium]|nr:hypothetical protein [Bacteroidota bacterium]
MKKTYYILIIAAFLITTVGPSCKKSTETRSTSIQYKITPFDSYIVLLRYNDDTGNQVTIPNPSLVLNNNNNFINGAKTFSVSTKPYSA